VSDITLLLEEVVAGEHAATDKLLPMVYQELKRLADSMMRGERVDHTLQSTALVNEAYLRLVKQDRPEGWQGRAHFFSVAAEAMRRILVEHARRKLGKQRGGDRKRVGLDASFADQIAAATNDPSLILEVDDALQSIATQDAETVELIKLRYFCGLSMAEAAETCGIPLSSAYAKWHYAKARLLQLLGESES